MVIGHISDIVNENSWVTIISKNKLDFEADKNYTFEEVQEKLRTALLFEGTLEDCNKNGLLMKCEIIEMVAGISVNNGDDLLTLHIQI